MPRQRARRRGLDFTEGVAITSSFHPDPQTHIEPVRYGQGSNAMGLLQSLLVDGGPRRVRRWLGTHRPAARADRRGCCSVRGWSRADGDRPGHAVGGQLADHPLPARLGSAARLVTSPGHGAPNPTWIPAGNEAVRLLAEEIDGIARRRRSPSRSTSR